VQTDLNYNYSFIDQYIYAVERLSFLLKNEGIATRPYADRTNLCFARLTYEEQRIQFQHLMTYLEVCEETIEQGHSLKETGFLVWNLFKKMGLKSDSDIFSLLNEKDIIEIYDSNNVQIFRNVNFFRICGYTLDDLNSIPWWKLFFRDEQISRSIFAKAAALFGGESNEVISNIVPVHIVEEVESELKLKQKINLKYLIPLRDSQNAIKCLVIEEGQLV
jgi:PAS domain-containing protein